MITLFFIKSYHRLVCVSTPLFEVLHGRFSLAFKGVKLWNSLVWEIKSNCESSSRSFKRLLKNGLFSKSNFSDLIDRT